MKTYYIFKQIFSDPIYELEAESFDQALEFVKWIYDESYNSGTVKGRSAIDLYLDRGKHLDIRKVKI